MDKRLKLRLGIENSERPRVREIGIFHAQHRDRAVRLCVFAEIDGGGARCIYARRVARVGEKRHVAFGRLVETGGAVDLDVVS